MATEIEIELFRSFGTHALKAISVYSSGIKIVIAPWNDLDNELEAVFNKAIIDSIDVENDGLKSHELPWDILAIDCKNIINGNWRFCIRCTNIEYVFKSQWPETKT